MGKKISKTKKILSIILSVVMIMSMLSVSMTTASAATTDDVETGGAINKTPYFDNSQAKWDEVYIIIGHSTWCGAYLLEPNTEDDDIYGFTGAWGDETAFYFADNPLGVPLQPTSGYNIDTLTRTGNSTVKLTTVGANNTFVVPEGVTGNNIGSDYWTENTTRDTTISKPLYFDNSKTKWDNVYIVIGHDTWSAAYQLDPVEVGSNKYKWDTSGWKDFTQFFFADSNLKNAGNGSIEDVTRQGNYTGNYITEPVDKDMFVPNNSDTTPPISGGWAANSTYSDGYLHNATADPVEGGSVSVTGTNSEATPEGTIVPADETVVYTATANTGYGFLGWYDGDTQITTDNPYSFIATNDTAYTAKFESYYEYSVSSNDVTKGTATVSDGTNTSETNIKSEADKSITYTAEVASDDYYFTGWTDGSGVVSTETTYTVTSAQEGLSLTAIFVDITTEITPPNQPYVMFQSGSSAYLNDTITIHFRTGDNEGGSYIIKYADGKEISRTTYQGSYMSTLMVNGEVIDSHLVEQISDVFGYDYSVTLSADNFNIGGNTITAISAPDEDLTKTSVESNPITLTVNANESFNTDVFIQDIKKDDTTVGGTVEGTTFTTENVYANNGEYQFAFNGVTATYNGVVTPVNYEVYDGETLIASTNVTDITADMVFASFTPTVGTHNYTVKATITNGTKYSVEVGTIALTVKANELVAGALTGKIDTAPIDVTTAGTFNKTSYDKTQGNFSFTFNAEVNEKVSTGADITYRYELVEQGSATPLRTSTESTFTFNINEENLLQAGTTYNVKATANYASEPTQTVEKTYSFTVTENPEWATFYIQGPSNWGKKIDRVAIYSSKPNTQSEKENYDELLVGTLVSGVVYEFTVPYEYVGTKYIGLKNSGASQGRFYGDSKLIEDGGYYVCTGPTNTNDPIFKENKVTSVYGVSVDGQAISGDTNNVTAPLGSELVVQSTVNDRVAVHGGSVKVEYYINGTLIGVSDPINSGTTTNPTTLYLSDFDEDGIGYTLVPGNTYTITAVVQSSEDKFNNSSTMKLTVADPIFAIDSYTKSKDFGEEKINIEVNGSNLNLGGYRYSTGDGQLTDFKYFNSTRNATITFPNVVDDTVVVYYYGVDHTTPMYKAVYSTGANSTRITYVRPEEPVNENVVQDVKIYVLDSDSDVNISAEVLTYTDSSGGSNQLVTEPNKLSNFVGEGNAQAIEYHFVPEDIGITEKYTTTIAYETSNQEVNLYGPLSHDLPTTLTYDGPTTIGNGTQVDLSAYISQDGTRKMHYTFAVDFLNSTVPSHYDSIIGEVDTENGYSASVLFTAPKIDEAELQLTIKVYAYSIDPESPQTGKGTSIDPLYTYQTVTITRDDHNKIYLDASNHDSLKACVTKNEAGEDVVYMKTSTGRTVEMSLDPEDVNATNKKVFVGYLTDEELAGHIRFSNNNGSYNEGNYYDTKRDVDGATYKFGKPENGFIFSKDNKDNSAFSENWGSYNTEDTATITEEDLLAELALTALNHYDFPADVTPSATEVLEDPQAYVDYIDHTKADVQYIFYDNSVTKWHEVWLYSWGGFDSGVDDKQYKTKRVEMMKIDTGDGRDIRYYKLPAGSLKSWNVDASEGFLFMDRDTSYVGVDYMQSTDLGNFTYNIADVNKQNETTISVNIKNNIFDADSNVIYPLFRADGFRNATERTDSTKNPTLKQRAFIEVVTDLYNTEYEVANVTFNIIPHSDSSIDTVHLYTNSLHSAYDFPFPYVDAFRKTASSDAFVASLNIPYTVDEATREITVQAEFGIEINGVYYGAEQLLTSIDNGFKINGKAIETGEVWIDLPTRVAGYSDLTGITENVVDIIGYEHSNTDITTSTGGTLDQNGTYATFGYGSGLEARVDVGVKSDNEQFIEIALQNTDYFDTLSQEGVVGRIAQRDIHINSNTNQTNQEKLLYQFSGWFKDRTLFQNPFDDLGNEQKATSYTPETSKLVNLGAFYEPRKGDETYTSYFILTDDMMNDLSDQWTIENLRWEATNILGEIDTSLGGTPEQLNPYLKVFGKDYDIDGVIFKVEYHSNIKSIRFYQAGSGDTIDVTTKMSTSQLNVLNGVRNEKVFYVLDYSKYDSTVISEIESSTGVRVFGWYDLMYEVNFTYPNEDTKFEQAGSKLTLDELNESNSSTQTAKLYVSANYKNVSPNIDSIYNVYAWEHSATSKLTAPQTTIPVIPNDVDTRGYTVNIGLDSTSKAAEQIADESVISKVSTVALVEKSQESTITYYKYNENYTSLINPIYTNNKTIDVEYEYVVQLETPETVDVNGKEVNFVGWYDTNIGQYVSYYYKHAFVATQEMNLIPVYDDTDDNRFRTDIGPLAITEDTLYETFLDDTTQKINMIFPIRYLIPNDITDYQLMIKYSASKEKIIDLEEDATWSEGIDVTDKVNAQDRVNYVMTTNLYKSDGSVQDAYLYVRPYIVYTDDYGKEVTVNGNIGIARPSDLLK